MSPEGPSGILRKGILNLEPSSILIFITERITGLVSKQDTGKDLFKDNKGIHI